MKLTTFLLPAISILATAPALACGPFALTIPYPEYFTLRTLPSMASYEIDENLRLWQQLTSDRIPLEDIRQAVYNDSYNMFRNRVCWSDYEGNKFYIYLNNSGDHEIKNLLSVAKSLEEGRAKCNSPWYYPSSRDVSAETGDFSYILELCDLNDERLRDRYGLQGVRALFASRCYAECIEYYDSVFAGIPDSNLMKRMAGRYVAGCWNRLDNTERADTLFALAGDIVSISADDPVAFAAALNPDAPQLMDYVRFTATDSASLADVIPVAKRLAANPALKCRGDWEYLLAYFYHKYAGDTREALRYMRSALRHEFSKPELADLARSYSMKINAQTGDASSLLADLKWIEGKCDVLSRDRDEWYRRLRNVVYADLVPCYLKRRDFTTAVMLCAFADNIEDINTRIYSWEGDRTTWSSGVLFSLQEMRASEKMRNTLDYATLSFQIMGSLSSDELIKVYSRMKSSSPLYNYLRTKMRTDSDFYCELIGTLALREENYDRAVKWFAKVSPAYMRTMNVYKCGYLDRDPFSWYPTRWETIQYPDRSHDSEKAVEHHRIPRNENVKLEFARRMADYSREMKHAADPDRRAMAALMYAIGRRNSFEECWALTQYWRGSWVVLFTPYYEYLWADVVPKDRIYDFLYDYEQTVGHKYTEAVFDKQVREAMRMFTTDEARARAEYLLGNLRTVIARYPSTSTAASIRNTCDNWRDWL